MIFRSICGQVSLPQCRLRELEDRLPGRCIEGDVKSLSIVHDKRKGFVFASGPMVNVVTVLVIAGSLRLVEPGAQMQDGSILSEADKTGGEVEQFLVQPVPWQPRNFIVLTKGIIVATLAV